MSFQRHGWIKTGSARRVGTAAHGRSPTLAAGVLSIAVLVIATVASLLIPTAARAACSYDMNGVGYDCPEGGGYHPPASRPSARDQRGSNDEDPEAEQRAAQYNQTWSQASAAFEAKNYALALQLYEQAVALNPGPAGKGNIDFVKGLMAWSSDPRSALAFFPGSAALSRSVRRPGKRTT